MAKKYCYASAENQGLDLKGIDHRCLELLCYSPSFSTFRFTGDDFNIVMSMEEIKKLLELAVKAIHDKEGNILEGVK